jgi:hypothetical protein
LNIFPLVAQTPRFFSSAAKEIFPKAAEKIGYTKALSVSLAVSNKKRNCRKTVDFMCGRKVLLLSHYAFYSVLSAGA